MKKLRQYNFLMNIFFLFSLMFIAADGVFDHAHSDHQFAKPLKEVLADIQKKYSVTIRYDTGMVSNKKVTYADWKYRPDVEVTLANILEPFELKAKKEKEKQYKLSYYEYYR